MITFRKKKYDLFFILLPLAFLVLLSGVLKFNSAIVVLFISTALLTLCSIVFRSHKNK